MSPGRPSPSIGGARNPTACGGAWSPAPRGLVMTRLFEAGSAKGFGVFFHCVVRGPDCILLDPALRYFRQYAFECPKRPLRVFDLSLESQGS